MNPHTFCTQHIELSLFIDARIKTSQTLEIKQQFQWRFL